MARPKKDNAEYFSHDADMRNDTKIRALRRKFGLEGYAIWCMLLEYLTHCDFFEFEYSELNIELLSGDFDVEPELLKEVMEYLINKLGLMQVENGNLMCLEHIKRFDALLSKRKRQRNEVIADDNTHSKVKYSKGEESKVKENPFTS